MNKIKEILILIFLMLSFLVNSFAQPPACTISVAVTPSSGNQPSRVIGNNQVLCIDGPGTYKGSITVNSGGHLVICGGNVTVYGSVAIMPGGKYWRTPTSRIIGSFVNYGATSNNLANCSSPEPEIEINGNGQTILSGDNSPSTAKGTYFGMTEIGSLSASQTFEIINNGAADLIISDEIVSLDNQFVVTQPSSSVVSSGSSISFQIKFIPSVEGLIESTITIPNNDTDEGSFTFNINGSGYIASLSSVSSGDFEDPSNWDCNCSPESRNHIFIEHDMVMNTSFNSNDGRLFYIGNDVNLSINSDANLNIAGVLMNKGFINGNLIINGETEQSPELGSVTNLEINNSSADGVTLNSDLSIPGRLKLTQGVFNLNNYSLIMDASSTKTASIVQENCTSYINGDVTIRQFVPEAAYGHHYLSTPMSNSILTGWEDDFEFKLNDSYFPHLYYYDEPNQEWVTPGSSEEEIVIGRGYTGYFSGERIVDLTGELNCGDVSVTLTNQGDGWNLIGNPYASQLNWDNVDIPEGVSGAIYLWDHIPSIWGRYATYVDGIGINGGSNVIPMMQGFFMFAEEESELTFKNSDRVQEDNGSIVFLSEKAKHVPTFRVSISGFGNEIETLVRFKENSLSDFEKTNDALLYPTVEVGGVDLATLSSDGKKLAINTLSNNDLSHKIPIYISVSKDGEYSLNLTSFDDFESTSNLILIDDFLNVNHDFRDGAYYFDSRDKGLENRFSLLIQNTPLRMNDEKTSFGEILKVGDKYALKLNVSINEKRTIRIFNLHGQLVSLFDINEGQTYYELPVLCNNLYFLTMANQNGKGHLKWVNK